LWIEEEIRNGLNHVLARDVVFHFETDHLRKLTEDVQNSAISVIEKDVEPLRLVLEGVMHGGTKNRVMSHVSEVYRQHYGPEINKDLVVALNPTKTPKYTSKARLEALWTRYSDIFHYVIIWHAERRECPEVCVTSPRHAV
jgi:regulator of replication initiation timing